MNMGIKKKVLIISTILLVILATIYSSYYFSKFKKYNSILSSANQAMSTGEYDKAIEYYTEALNYKKDVSVSKKIELVKLLKNSKESYDSAVKQMSDKKYLEAIDLFKKVDKQDDKRYSTAQSKINECTKLYVSDNLNIANDNFKNNKFDEANKYIDNILKIDANNSDAKKLKDNITKIAQSQKEQQELKEKGVRQLGELRKKIAGQKYMVLDKSIPINRGLSQEEFDKQYGKYFGYCFISVGTGKWEDSDDKLVEPDVIINGKLAYKVESIDPVVYYGGGNGYIRCFLGVDGKGYTEEELRNAINNNTAFYKDGTELSINGHTVGAESINLN